MRVLSIITAIGLCASPALADDFEVTLGAPWDGIAVPPGQQCNLFGNGNGATPPIIITGLPVGTVMVHVEFNDKSYEPLAHDGGHGTIGFTAHAGAITLPSVPGLSTDMPPGAFVIRPARSSGRYASVGYLPPCSGGRGNRYMADVIAFDAGRNELGTASVELGLY